MNKNFKTRSYLISLLIIMLTFLATPVFAYETSVISEEFVDLENHWATESMTQLIEMGIVNGYENEVVDEYGESYYEYYIKPNQSITRAEFATMLTKALGLDLAEVGTTFTDVSNHWAEPYVYTLYNQGIVSGYEDGTFKPGAKITRSEIVTMLTRALNNQSEVTETTNFTDLNSDHWAYNSIQQAVLLGLVNGYSDGSFKPNCQAKRAEVMTMLVRFFNNSDTQDVTDEELFEVVNSYNYAVEAVLSKAPDLSNPESPYDWTPVYQYVTGAEQLSVDFLQMYTNEIALLGTQITLEFLELGQPELISKSDYTAVVIQYGKLRTKIGVYEEITEGDQLINLMKENGKWVVYSTYYVEEVL